MKLEYNSAIEGTFLNINEIIAYLLFIYICSTFIICLIALFVAKEKLPMDSGQIF